MLLNDELIKEQINKGMIEQGLLDFDKSGLSHGVGPFSYDVALAPKVLRFTGDILDPLNAHNEHYQSLDIIDNYVLVPPLTTVLGHSVEVFKLPNDITGLLIAKSTYQRCGLLCQSAVLDAGWAGQITLAFVNTNQVPVKMYINQGCAQVLFFKSKPCALSYSQRCGKYHNKHGINISMKL